MFCDQQVLFVKDFICLQPFLDEKYFPTKIISLKLFPN